MAVKREGVLSKARPATLTASQKVELYIKEAIYHGALKPRERVVELEIAKKVGCSRAPVREAILRMMREGVVVTIPRRGIFIRDFSEESIEEIFLMRAKLESLCVVRLRKRMTEEDRKALLARLHVLETACADGDEERFFEADMKVHRTIWKLSGSTEIRRVLNAMMVPFILMVARSTAAKVSLAESLQHHKDYVEMVLNAPEDKLEREVELYFRTIYDKLFRSQNEPFQWHSGTATWLLDTGD
jgi:DNA-binding GntR family transcriptional regulator